MKAHDYLKEAIHYAFYKSQDVLYSLEPWIKHNPGPQNKWNKWDLQDTVAWFESFISYFDDACYQLLIDVITRPLFHKSTSLGEYELLILEVMEILDGKERKVIENEIKRIPVTVSKISSEVQFWTDIRDKFGVKILAHQSEKSNPDGTVLCIIRHGLEYADIRIQGTNSESIRTHFKNNKAKYQKGIDLLEQKIKQEESRKLESGNGLRGVLKRVFTK